jgi:asparaginyl-tRNA synthetase
MPEETAPALVEAAKPAPPVATIADIGRHEGQSVTLRGWLYNSRESGKLLFPIFRDGTGSIQGVAHVKSVSSQVFDALKNLTQESSVIVTGKVRADKRAPGGFELDVEGVEVVQRVPESISDHAERPRGRIFAGAPPLVGAQPSPVGHPAHSCRDYARGG